MDVSRVLGQYMLQGWVLTDEICSKCDATPLMRAPRNRPVETFCAQCDGGPSGSAARTEKSSAPPVPNDTSSASASSSISLSRSKHSASGVSTPPTDVASLAEEEEFVLPIPSEEMLQRRAQSDLASAEIGRRLLQGWAMLADECPNDTCYGVPLLRPPKRLSDGNPSNTKECVVCHDIYSEVRNASGVLRLQSQKSVAQPSVQPHQPSNTTTRPKSPVIIPTVTTDAPPPGPPATIIRPAEASRHIPRSRSSSRSTPAVTATIAALENSLKVLSGELQNVSSSPTYVNASRITELATSISAVADALEKTRRLTP